MVFNQMKHFVKMANVFWSNATWFATLCIHLLPTRPPISLTNYLPIYYPPTYLLFTYLPTYPYFFTFIQPTYLPTHPFIYLYLTIRCSH